MKKPFLYFLMLVLAWMPIGSRALADGLPDLGEVSQGDLSPQMEKRIGQQVMNDIRLHDPDYLDDPEIEAYLGRIGSRLAAQIEGSHPDFSFFVIKDSTLNAFAMPGGFIGVHTGLILAAQSESELASVLAHEISHVTQHHIARGINKQQQGQIAALVAMAVAILASRGDSQVTQGAVVGSQAAAIQNQLNYSRDFEREADRLGFTLLDKAGFDVRGMATFFGRLEKFGRLYENNAPSYLRTHPMTTERMTDIDNRVVLKPYRQVPDSIDFLLVKAKLRAQEGTPADAVADLTRQVGERKFNAEIAARYGLASARLRADDAAGAETEMQRLRKEKADSPMLDTLAAAIERKAGNTEGALKILRQSLGRYPQARAVAYGIMECLLDLHRGEDAVRFGNDDLQSYTTDYRMYALLARAYAAQGKQLQQHRAQAEYYYLTGQLMPAIEQLTIAQRAPDGDFYGHSQVDARLRELKSMQAEEAKDKKTQ
ncbi:MAG TPA: M48 family metalloprotease [Rhodocyclaceae bacterium]|nr:M48 family metalloprotease [Rhodocyclaceae bacterium]